MKPTFLVTLGTGPKRSLITVSRVTKEVKIQDVEETSLRMVKAGPWAMETGLVWQMVENGWL